MGRTSNRLEFAPGELRLVGGDYGELVFEAHGEAARLAVESIIGAARCGIDVALVSLLLDVEDRAEPELEDRHEGRSRTHERGAEFGARAAGSGLAESMAAEESGGGKVEGSA